MYSGWDMERVDDQMGVIEIARSIRRKAQESHVGTVLEKVDPEKASRILVDLSLGGNLSEVARAHGVSREVAARLKVEHAAALNIQKEVAARDFMVIAEQAGDYAQELLRKFYSDGLVNSKGGSEPTYKDLTDTLKIWNDIMGRGMSVRGEVSEIKEVRHTHEESEYDELHKRLKEMRRADPVIDVEQEEDDG